MTSPTEERELLTKIRKRGHFEVVIRPTAFVEQRANRSDLFDIVQRTKVSLRGWDFPHIDRKPPHIDTSWVGQFYEWQHQLEMWRLYLSGQFVSISGIPNEWRDQSGFWPQPPDGWAPNTTLSIGEVIATFTEAVEFAGRLSQTTVGDERMQLSVKLGMMEGRLLTLESERRMPLFNEYRSSIATIPVERVMSQVDLRARPRELAVDCAEEVFSFFAFKAPREILTDIQKEIFPS